MAKILLVEDDNNLSEIYQARMVAEGYTVVAAHDGEEALALAAKEKPDLIISDVMMPKISGFEMLDILRNTQGLKDTKVIMLTALGQAEDKTRADALGADRYLIKSQVTLEDIVKTAQELLNSAAAAPASAAAPAGTPAATAVPTQPAATAVTIAPVTPAPPMPVATPPVPATPAVAMAVTQAPPETPTPVSPATPTAPAVPPTAPPAATPVATAPAPAVETPVMTTPITPATSSETAPPVTATPQPVAPAPVESPDTTSATQSAQQESDAVQDQIASFENQPTTAPAEPAPAPTPTVETPAPVVEAAAIPAPPSNDPDTAADNKLVADAVNDLMSNATDTPAPTSEPVVAPISPAATTAPDATMVAPTPTDTPTAPPTAPTPVPDTSSIADSAPVARKKIIQPISGETTKPDIGSLLAAEEARGGQTTAPTVPPPSAALDAPTPPPHQPGNVFTPTIGANPGNGNDTGIDPNSIAL